MDHRSGRSSLSPSDSIAWLLDGSPGNCMRQMIAHLRIQGEKEKSHATLMSPNPLCEHTPKDRKIYLSNFPLSPVVPNWPDSCSNLFSVAAINSATKSSFRRKRFTCLRDCSPLSREGGQMRNSARTCRKST